jgi:Fur family ferric uptake transcriptional regulator
MTTSASEPRTTRQQRAIRELLGQTDEFRSAQDLHQLLLQSSGDRIGLATVYRALGRMADNGDVDVLVGPEGEALYRRCSSGHHHHLVCRQCGATVEVDGPAVESWTRSVAAAEGFTEVSHTLEIFGLCARCSQP